MTRRDRLNQILNDIANGMIGGVNVSLDWQRRSLRINGAEFGHLLKTNSLWRFLACLALRKPRKVELADFDDAYLSITQPVDGKKPCNLRRELGRSLPPGVAALIIHTTPKRGYRLAPNVRVPGRGEVSIRYGEECAKRVDEKTLPRKTSSIEDEETADDPDDECIADDVDDEDGDTDPEDGDDDRED